MGVHSYRSQNPAFFSVSGTATLLLKYCHPGNNAEKLKNDNYTWSVYSTTSLMFLGYPEIKNAFAAGDIFISNINTSATILLDN